MVFEKEASYVDDQEAARILGLNQRAVRNLIARRRLESKREEEGAAARLLASVASLEKLRSERQLITWSGGRTRCLALPPGYSTILHCSACCTRRRWPRYSLHTIVITRRGRS